jgi:hypothetical protein
MGCEIEVQGPNSGMTEIFHLAAMDRSAELIILVLRRSKTNQTSFYHHRGLQIVEFSFTPIILLY